MPSPNALKIYEPGGIYHVFNRGVDKTNIFLSEDDYKYFLYLLERYLLPPNKFNAYRVKNYHNRIDLLAYTLMPNHYHLLIKQVDTTGMQEFVQSLCLSYATRFNKNHKRVGHLFQDRYKATRIKDILSLLRVSKYIHRNPSELDADIFKYQFSSIRNYIGSTELIDKYVDSSEIMQYLDNDSSLYRNFMQELSLHEL
ncbi:transposase [Patescibacteria group bacterium]